MKKINGILIISMIIGTLWFTIFQYDTSRILTYVAVIPVIFIPNILRKTKYQLSDRELFGYYLFVFLAYFLGSVVNLYQMIWWYDLFMHFSSGIFTFILGMKILEREKNCFSFRFKMFLGLCIVMFIASMWEFFEFGSDFLLGMNLQHQIDTGVVDTMQDMLAAFIGGILSIGVCSLSKKLN